jgi:hypothetical protein
MTKIKMLLKEEVSWWVIKHSIFHVPRAGMDPTQHELWE